MTATAPLVIAVLAGFLGLATCGEELRPVAGWGAVAWLLARPIGPRLPSLPWAPVTIAVLVAVALGLGARPVVASGALLAYLQVQRALARSGPRDDRLALLLALLMLVLAASRTASPAFLPAAVAFAAATPWALLRAHAPDVPALRATPLLVLGVPALAAVAFLALPRLVSRELPPAGPGLALTGFSPEVELGHLGELLDDDTPVFRASVETADGVEVRQPLYFRGVVLDRFDGRRWTSTGPREPVPPGSLLDQALTRAPAGGFRVIVQREPLEEQVLFTFGRVLGVSARGGVLRDRQGALYLDGPSRPVEYVLHTMPPFRPDQRPLPEADPPLSLPIDLEGWLALPPDLDPRIPALASAVAGGEEDPWRKVDALRTHLLDGWTYTRAPRDVGEEQPLPRFLFDDRSGHCEYFASALAVLARAEGVPARVVNGFVGGERNELGGYWLFRRHHAHSWVEAHVPGLGWVTVDATPAPGAPPARSTRGERALEAMQHAWTAGVLDYDRQTQAAAVLDAGRRVEALLPARRLPEAPWLGLLLLVGGGAGLFTVVYRFSREAAGRLAGETPARRPRARIERLHDRARRRLERAGWAIPATLPPVEAARWLRARAGHEAEALEELAWLHYRVRWGGEDEAPLLPQARELAERVERIGRA